MHLSPRVTAAAAALLLTGALTGCSMPGEGSGSSSGGKNGGAGGGSEGSVGKASFDNASKPVVKGTFDSPLAVGAKVDIAIMGLKAKERLATLSVQMTPRVLGVDRINPYRLNGEHGLATSLIDPVNLKRYVVVKDSSGKELQSDDIFTHLTADQSTPLYYTFAAPPENVKTIDVQIGTWPTFRDVPVGR